MGEWRKSPKYLVGEGDLVVGTLKMRGQGATGRVVHFLQEVWLVMAHRDSPQRAEGVEACRKAPAALCSICRGTSPGILLGIQFSYW